MPLMWVKRNAHWRQGLEKTGDQVPPLPRSQNIHTDNPNHNITLENTKILSVEHKWFERGVKEAIYITAMNPSLNRDGGRYNLPPVWNNIIKEKVTDGAGTTNGGGPSLRNSVSVPVVSNTNWKLRHTDEGCSDSRKLCKCCHMFLSCVMKLQTYRMINHEVLRNWSNRADILFLLRERQWVEWYQ